MPRTWPRRRSARGSLTAAPAFSPTDIAGLAAWYDATVGVTDAGGGAVSAWADQSGNSRTLTQGTAGSRPTTGTRTQNGLNVIDFDGTADFLDASSGFAQGTSDTVFIVCLNDDGADSVLQVAYNGNSGATATCRITKTGANAYRATSGTALDLGVVNTSAHVITAAFNGASGSELRVDGVSLGTGSTGTNSGTYAPHLGRSPAGSQYWDGWIAEVLHYESVLAAPDIEAVEAYLIAKWGL